MKKLISDYDYSRQFILVEKKGKKIYESLPIEKSTEKTSSALSMEGHHNSFEKRL